MLCSWLLPACEAVITATESEFTSPAVAVNTPAVAPAAISTCPGTVSKILLLDKVTAAPALPAGFVSVTVQAVFAPECSTED
jgi:hypothetical protein